MVRASMPRRKQTTNWSSPARAIRFLSNRSSSACSATTSFNARTSRQDPLPRCWLPHGRVTRQATFASLQELPSTSCNRDLRRCLPGGIARQCWTYPAGRPERFGSSLGQILLVGRPADGLHEPLPLRTARIGFLSCLMRTWLPCADQGEPPRERRPIQCQATQRHDTAEQIAHEAVQRSHADGAPAAQAAIGDYRRRHHHGDRDGHRGDRFGLRKRRRLVNMQPQSARDRRSSANLVSTLHS